MERIPAKEKKEKKKMKKNLIKRTIATIMVAGMAAACFAGCKKTETAGSFDAGKEITVVTREDGSGTRGAFIEITGVEQKDADGNKVDYTSEDAVISNSTNEVITTVSGDTYAIGYISLGSLNNTVKALKVDGVEATTDNVASGKYTVSRPFNIATKGEAGEAAQDFINFIMSADGQAVIEDNGYIAVSDAKAFESNGATGKIVVGGSSSVSPVMEKLIEAYKGSVTIELQTSDSSTGMENAASGSYDIGMASRELKDSELDNGLVPTVIAMDGIAVIVNNDNTTEGLTKEQIKNIFTGDVTTWEDATK